MSNNILSNFLWRFIERCGAQGVSFVVSIILARLLMPEVYGTVALVTIFITILQVFVDSGMGNALIQKKNADNLDFSTVFYFNLAMCSILYMVIFFAAPTISTFYGISELTGVIRVLGLTLIVSGLKNIQQAYVSKNMLFKRFFWATLSGTLFSAFIGIWMAYRGYGIWALVIQNLSNTVIDTVILWLTVNWRPMLIFSFNRLKILFSYGWKLLVSSLLDTVYSDLRQLVIGKMYSSEDLAFYNRGNQIPSLLVSNINSSIDSVLLPTMANEQDNCERLQAMTRRAIKISTYIIAPMMMGLVFCGHSLIELILTEKWLQCLPFMRIFCITYLFYPIHTANLNAIKALGRSDLFLKLEIAKKIVGLILLVSTMWFGVLAMAYSLLVSTVLSMVINSWPNKKLLSYGYFDQMKDIFPALLLSIFMGLCIWTVELLKLSNIITLLLQITLGIIIYLGISKLFKLESFMYLYGLLKSFFEGKKR